METKTDKKELRIGVATDEQIATWKKLHGDVFCITVKNHVCYLKGFDRKTMKYILSQLKVKVNTESKQAEMDMERIFEIGEIGLQNSWLGGSEEIRQKDELWVAAAMQAGELFQMVETHLEKL